MKAMIAAGHRPPPSLLPAPPLRTFYSSPENSQSPLLKSQNPITNFHSTKTFRPLNICATSDNNGNEFDGGEPRSGGEEEKQNGLSGNGRPRLNMKWVEMLVNPDPDNVVAVGLTGVLGWASVQVLWQLFVISIAIILAALKYSFIAALLIFILITLL